jgi:hypothetical protein
MDGHDGPKVREPYDRRAYGLVEDAADRERPILVLRERDGAQPVRDDDGITHLVA